MQSVSKDIYNVIQSGSKGNCEIAFTSIMIDIGVPFTAIKPHLYDVQIVLISHEHFSDHFNISTLKRLQFERPSLRIGVGKWMLPHLVGFKNIDVYDLNKWYDYGEFRISIGTLYHDVKNCFYRLEKNGYKIFRATDTFTLDGITAKDYDLLCIEHNYSEEIVNEIINRKKKLGEFCYQEGAINTHLSEDRALDFIFKNRKETTQIIRLHESEHGY